MAIALGIFGVACTAFCVWLTVRIINRRKKPGVAFWVTVGLVGLVLYVLSMGPATWLVNQDWSPEWTVDAVELIYCPIFLTCRCLPQTFGEVLLRYNMLWY